MAKTNHLTVDQLADGYGWLTEHFNVSFDGDENVATCLVCGKVFYGENTIEQLGPHTVSCDNYRNP